MEEAEWTVSQRVDDLSMLVYGVTKLLGTE